MHPARRWLVVLSAALAAIAAVLAVMLPAASVSASAVPAAGNGVGAHHPGMILPVGASHAVSAGEGRRTEPPQARFAAGACVAAEDAGASIPDSTIIAHGGTREVLYPPGEVFSGSQGQTVTEAGQGVVHGKFRWTTAGDIRTAGGTVEPAPEMNPIVGKINYQHVDVCLGEGACQWSDLVPNVAKNPRFGGKDYPFYEGYLGWGP